MAFYRPGAAPAVVVLLLLLVATENMGTTAEARTCLSQSHKFKGTCLSNSNCASVCKTENFPGGECNTHHLERKCYCKKVC